MDRMVRNLPAQQIWILEGLNVGEYFELYARTAYCILPHFCPPTFLPCLNPMFKNGSFLSVVALFWTLSHLTPYHSGSFLTFAGRESVLKLTFSGGKNNKVYVFCSTPSQARTRLMPTFGVSVEKTGEGPKFRWVQVQGSKAAAQTGSKPRWWHATGPSQGGGRSKAGGGEWEGKFEGGRDGEVCRERERLNGCSRRF